MEQFHKDFGEEWSTLEDAEAYEEAYQDWKDVQTVQKQVENTPEYRLNWGGGSVSSPITENEFASYVNQNGWPTKDQIRDTSGTETKATTDDSLDPSVASGFNLWGRGRSARNIDREVWGDSKNKFDLIDESIFNYIEHLPRSEADVGDVMLVISGSRSASNPRSTWRFVVLVTGTSIIGMHDSNVKVHHEFTNTDFVVTVQTCVVQTCVLEMLCQ